MQGPNPEPKTHRFIRPRLTHPRYFSTSKRSKMTALTSSVRRTLKNPDVACIPSSVITGEENNCLPDTVPIFPCPSPTTIAIALYSYHAHSSGDLSFTAETFIIVFRKNRSGWWYGAIGEEQGWIPCNYVVDLNTETRLLEEITQTNGDTLDLIKLADQVLERLETIRLQLLRNKIVIQECTQVLRKIAPTRDDHHPISCRPVYLFSSVTDEGNFTSDH